MTVFSLHSCSVCVCLCVSISLCLSVSLSRCLSVSISLSVSLFVSLSLSVSLSLCLTVSLSPSLPPQFFGLVISWLYITRVEDAIIQYVSHVDGPMDQSMLDQSGGFQQTLKKHHRVATWYKCMPDYD